MTKHFVRLKVADYAHRMDLHIAREAGDLHLDVYGAPTVTRIEDGRVSINSEPAFLSLPETEMTEFLQAIVDEAFDHGIRPRAMEQNSDKDAHLLDMRAIAFKKLGIDLPTGR